MPSLLLPRFSLQDMSDKKSLPRKEKPFNIRSPQSDNKGMKRKLLSPGSPTDEDFDKKTPSKRKRGCISLETSPVVSHLSNPKTPGSGSRAVPLSERQQLAMIMRMSDESTQITDSSSKPLSPTYALHPLKKNQLDKKVFKRNERGEMPIHLAAIKGDIKNIKQLIKAGADVNVADFAGWTPLHEASNRGWFTIAKHLLKAGANVNVQGLENDTPLHDASINGHKRLVELLLKHGANPIQPNAKGKTPLDVASSPDMVRILRKEIICSASDTSSIDDVRSPLSPYNVISLKVDDKSLDSEDVNQSSKSELSSLSSSNHRQSLPKSPNGNLSSPRLCLKFQRDNLDHMNRRAHDSGEPQYKSYSVTNMSIDSCLDPTIFPVYDSPTSSLDSSDMYNPSFDAIDFSGRTLVNNNNLHNVDGNSLVTESLLPNLTVLPYHGSIETKRNNDGIPFMSSVCTISDTQKSFKPTLGWSYLKNDDSMDLPNLEVDSSESIPSQMEAVEVNSLCNSITSSYTGDPNQIYNTVVTSSSSFHNSHKTNDDTSICSQSIANVIQGHEVSHSTVSQSNTGDIGKCSRASTTTNNNTVKCVSHSFEQSSLLTLEKWDVHPAPSPNVHSTVHSDSVQPCSPTHTELEVKIFRPSTPKVPPLKIIIPCKSQPSSLTLDSNDRLKLITNVKSALPYVINSYQNTVNDRDAQRDSKTELKPSNSNIVTSSHPVLHNLNTELESVAKPDLNGDNLEIHEKSENDNNSGDNGDMDVEAGFVDICSVKAQNERITERLSNHESDDESKRNDKKDEPTQRVLRSTVRSQQQAEVKTTKQQKQQLLDKLDKSGVIDLSSSVIDTTVTTSKPILQDEEDCNIPPRKRKVKTKPDNALPIPQEESESPLPVPANTRQEKVPNPFEVYLNLRKQVAQRRCTHIIIGTLCLKVPHGFKDYLLKTCNYVLQGNTTSTLSIPTLSPPNSVKDKMRDLFIQQEEVRYKLRLQHLIERQKLILTMEQENLRIYGRAACALANHVTPLSVCTILRDQEIYNFTENHEDKDKKNRTRYNGRQFLSWIQDVEDKYERIKELLILRQKQEADSLYAYQKLEWEWRLKELSLCDRNITPDIDQLHVPLVFVLDNFDLLPT